MAINGGFGMGSMPQSQTTQAGPAIQPQRPPASPAMFPAAIPPQSHGQRPMGQALAPPVQPPQPAPAPMQMPVVGAMPAFPQQFSPTPAPDDAFRNRLAAHLQAFGHPADNPLPYRRGPTIDPRIRAMMDAPAPALR